MFPAGGKRVYFIVSKYVAGGVGGPDTQMAPTRMVIQVGRDEVTVNVVLDPWSPMSSTRGQCYKVSCDALMA